MDAATGRVDDVTPDRSGGWIRHADIDAGIERIEAYFAGRAYDMHRHDTYAIGRTLNGVQTFTYRGGLRAGVPHTTMVLYPDEPHDGEAGSEGGFCYRMIYIEPALIQAALGGRPLPFIASGVSADPRLGGAVDALLGDMDAPLDRLEYDDAIYDLAQAMSAASGERKPPRRPINFIAAERTRELLHAHLDGSLSLAGIETEIGRDRWSLSRDFRAAYGTSPHRYVVMRRLDRARAAMRAGETLAAAAAMAGFADQAHMTRHFRRAFGLTPAHWHRLHDPPLTRTPTNVQDAQVLAGP